MRYIISGGDMSHHAGSSPRYAQMDTETRDLDPAVEQKLGVHM